MAAVSNLACQRCTTAFFMLGGLVAAYVKALQLRLGKQEKVLSEYKLYVAERYASKEYLSETKREILDSLRDLARRIEHP